MLEELNLLGLTVWYCDDGTYELFSLRPDFSLSQYFDDYTVLWQKEWLPATFSGRELVETNCGDDVYVIGDANFPCMEAAYVSGLSIAQKLINQRKAGAVA